MPPNRPQLELVTSPDPEDVRVVAEGVVRSLEEALGQPHPRTSFSVFARDGDGRVVAGLNARLAYGDLHLDQLWCADDFRGRGLGTALLRRAEAHGRRHRAAGALLNTTQALLAFYEERGYEVIGSVPGAYAGRTVFFLRKDLGDGDGSDAPAAAAPADDG